MAPELLEGADDEDPEKAKGRSTLALIACGNLKERLDKQDNFNKQIADAAWWDMWRVITHSLVLLAMAAYLIMMPILIL